MSTNGLILTRAGLDLYNRTQTGEIITFSHVEIGAGEWNNNVDPESVTGLVDSRMSFQIQSATAQGDGTTLITIAFTNEGLKTGFFHRETGIFANDPVYGQILYAVDYSEGGVVPAYGGAYLAEEILRYYVKTGNAENIKVVVSNTSVFATQLDLEDHNTDTQAHPDIRSQIGALSPKKHTHTSTDITDLEQKLDAKSNIGHKHTSNDIVGLTASELDFLRENFNKLVTGAAIGTEGPMICVEHESFVLEAKGFVSGNYGTDVTRIANWSSAAGNLDAHAIHGGVRIVICGDSGTFYECINKDSRERTLLDISPLYGDVTWDFTIGNQYSFIVFKEDIDNKGDLVDIVEISPGGQSAYSIPESTKQIDPAADVDMSIPHSFVANSRNGSRIEWKNGILCGNSDKYIAIDFRQKCFVDVRPGMTINIEGVVGSCSNEEERNFDVGWGLFNAEQSSHFCTVFSDPFFEFRSDQIATEPLDTNQDGFIQPGETQEINMGVSSWTNKLNGRYEIIFFLYTSKTFPNEVSVDFSNAKITTDPDIIEKTIPASSSPAKIPTKEELLELCPVGSQCTLNTGYRDGGEWRSQLLSDAEYESVNGDIIIKASRIYDTNQSMMCFAHKKDCSWQRYLPGYPTGENLFVLSSVKNEFKVDVKSSFSGLGYDSEQQFRNDSDIRVGYKSKSRCARLAALPPNIYMDNRVYFLSSADISAGANLLYELIGNVPTLEPSPYMNWSYLQIGGDTYQKAGAAPVGNCFYLPRSPRFKETNAVVVWPGCFVREGTKRIGMYFKELILGKNGTYGDDYKLNTNFGYVRFDFDLNGNVYQFGFAEYDTGIPD
ncbi:hypothetical protein [Maridesulfovibrio bastinii]|uniref:hypothetical protein n=1 Tax=Maridesulfovibrio bastinii TaxID=47157 RepID=UPI00041D4DBF|nr:hypothetical protein [Maridesulfovibrio bastinii]